MTIHLDDDLVHDVELGFISHENATILCETRRWLDANQHRLLRDHPFKEVTVCKDPSVPGGYAMYVGETYQAEKKARHFSPGMPFITLTPCRDCVDCLPPTPDAMLMHFWDRAKLLLLDDDSKDGPAKKKEGDDAKKDDNIKKEDDPKKAEELKRVKRQQKETNDVLVKMHQDGKLTDKDFAKTFGPEYHDGMYTSGFIVSGKAECIKNWLIDSGATNRSYISEENLADIIKKGGTAKLEGETKTTTGSDKDAKIKRYSGITMRFVRKAKDGSNEIVDCKELVGISADSDVIGLDQLKATGTKLTVDPAGNTGELVAR